MHAVYGPTGDMIYGPVLAAGDAQSYMDESAVVCDTSGWAVLPVDIMSTDEPALSDKIAVMDAAGEFDE